MVDFYVSGNLLGINNKNYFKIESNVYDSLKSVILFI